MTSNALSRRLCIPAVAALAAAVFSFGGGARTALAAACPLGATGNCTASQTDNVTIAAGSLSLAFQNPAVNFGTVAEGTTSAAATAGFITETNTLGSATAWTVGVAASAMGTINQSNITINTTASTFACSVTAPNNCSGSGATLASLTDIAFSGAISQTIMNGTAAAQGSFNQSGVTYKLSIPWGIAAGSTPSGTLTYTITG